MSIRHKPQHTRGPRPQLSREANASSWLRLNGLWELDYTSAESLNDPPFGRTLPSKILVPYPVESSLSGIRKQPVFGYMWYRRTLPIFGTNHHGNRIPLHFGAVDWECVVYVDGHLVGKHSGGYTAFSFDITKYVDKTDHVELLVGVYDPSDCARQEHKLPDPSGKNIPGQLQEGPNPCPANLIAADARGQQPIGKQSWGNFGNKSGTSGGNSQGIKYTPTTECVLPRGRAHHHRDRGIDERRRDRVAPHHAYTRLYQLRRWCGY